MRYIISSLFIFVFLSLPADAFSLKRLGKVILNIPKELVCYPYNCYKEMVWGQVAYWMYK